MELKAEEEEEEEEETRAVEETKEEEEHEEHEEHEEEEPGDRLRQHAAGDRRGRGGPPVLALLPGSREQELRRHQPLMREMCAALALNAPAGTRAVFLALPQHRERLSLEASTWPLPATVVPSATPADRAAAFGASTAAVAAMGTATAGSVQLPLHAYSARLKKTKKK